MIPDDWPLIPGIERPACFEIVPTAHAVNGADNAPLRLPSWRDLSITRRRMNARMPGVCEPSSICIKGGLGAISSSRCQTTRGPGTSPHGRESFSLLDEQGTAIVAQLSHTAATITDESNNELRPRTQGTNEGPRSNARQGPAQSRPDEPKAAGQSRGKDILDHRSGGARRDRTDDLLLAKQALSQLSYGPFQISGFSNQASS